MAYSHLTWMDIEPDGLNASRTAYSNSMAVALRGQLQTNCVQAVDADPSIDKLFSVFSR